MRFMVWLLGVMVVLLGLEGLGSKAWQWAAVWWFAAALWFLVGLVLILSVATRTLLNKAGAGGLEALRRSVQTPPAPRKEG